MLSCQVSKQLSLVLARTSVVVATVANSVASAGSVTAMIGVGGFGGGGRGRILSGGRCCYLSYLAD